MAAALPMAIAILRAGFINLAAPITQAASTQAMAQTRINTITDIEAMAL